MTSKMKNKKKPDREHKPPIPLILTRRETLILSQWLIGDDRVHAGRIGELALEHNVSPARMWEIIHKIGRKAAGAHRRVLAADTPADDEFTQTFLDQI